MTLTVLVATPIRTWTFQGKTHWTSRTEDRKLDSENFYMRFSGKTPLGVHCEIEILQPTPGQIGTRPVNIHYSESPRRPFMCYPHHIPNHARALEVFEVWSVGTAHILDGGTSFGEVFNQEKGNFQMILEAMASRFRTSVTSIAQSAT